MGDTILVSVAIVLPLVFGGCLVAFVKRRRAARAPARWPQLMLGNSVVLLLLLSVVFLMGESYYRFIYDSTDSFARTRTSERWFERHFQRNNAQIRDSVDYMFARRNHRPRITFVGDSFTAGHGIANAEDRFANRIRNARRGAWEVHVFADIGRDTGEELKLIPSLQHYRYDCDVVVLVYCLNDIGDLIPQQQSIAGRAAQPESRPGFLVEHSFLLNTYYYRLKARFDPLVSGYYDYLLAAYDGPIWDAQQERLRELRNQCQAAGGRLQVVIFPFVHALGPTNQYRPIHGKLARFWQESDVPYLDLLPTLEEHASESLMVNRYDAHPNERAHAIAADAIVKFLEQNL